MGWSPRDELGPDISGPRRRRVSFSNGLCESEISVSLMEMM